MAIETTDTQARGHGWKGERIAAVYGEVATSAFSAAHPSHVQRSFTTT